MSKSSKGLRWVLLWSAAFVVSAPLSAGAQPTEGETIDRSAAALAEGAPKKVALKEVVLHVFGMT